VGDFFEEPTPGEIGARIEPVDAVIGNPPFVRYQEHRGDARRKASAAALKQGVRLSGLASSWAALLIHASGFLKPDGRLAMVVPAELLSVGYAEPVRQWLKSRFASVHLVLFEQLQFAGAEEQTVLLVARGSGGCSAFTLHHVRDASDLSRLHIYDANAFTPRPTGKWTELMIPEQARGILRSVTEAEFSSLDHFGNVELGTVTGANDYFTISESTRRQYHLIPNQDVVRTVPPGSRHLKGLQFTTGQWEQLRLTGERVWMLAPKSNSPSGGLAEYLEVGAERGVQLGYKCRGRKPWWRPPMVSAPDLFFTYMSHISPRLIANQAGTTFVNSMHGVRLSTDSDLREALPFIALNTVTMLAAEVVGRGYGGGVLKLEPREASSLPLPNGPMAREAWRALSGRRAHLDELVRTGNLDVAASEVDSALICAGLSLNPDQRRVLQQALIRQRARRQGRVKVG